MRGWWEGGGEVRTRALSGESRDTSIVDRTNGDLNMLFKVTKLTKNNSILLLGGGRRRKWEML